MHINNKRMLKKYQVSVTTCSWALTVGANVCNLQKFQRQPESWFQSIAKGVAFSKWIAAHQQLEPIFAAAISMLTYLKTKEQYA
jgi:hypothetical protein